MSTSYTNKNVLIEVLIYTDILIIIHSQINLKPHFSCCGPCTVKCPQAFIFGKVTWENRRSPIVTMYPFTESFARKDGSLPSRRLICRYSTRVSTTLYWDYHKLLMERQKMKMILKYSICCGAGVPPATIFCADKMSAPQQSDFLPLCQIHHSIKTGMVSLSMKRLFGSIEFSSWMCDWKVFQFGQFSMERLRQGFFDFPICNDKISTDLRILFDLHKESRKR